MVLKTKDPQHHRGSGGSALLRKLALSNQGLTAPQPFGKGLAGTHSAIEHLGYVQIDTLSVVERAHHHVLWSRVPGYQPSHLNQLIADQRIFEYWYHAAAYLPMRDYRFALPNMQLVRRGENRYYNHADVDLMNEILACVRDEGPLRLRDLDTQFKGQKKGPGTWWNMAPGKRAIERLFMQGDLMVCGRNGMEKVYDLAERCLPADIDLRVPTLQEYARYLFDTTLRAHGVFTWKQLLHLKTGKPMRDAMQAVLDEQLETGLVTALDSANNSTAAPCFYADSQILEKSQEQLNKPALKVLSPFDNVVIHRDRLAALFEFDYRIECYVPAAKREYGYFCLPILYGDQFVGRIDCKAHRAEATLEVLSLHLSVKTLDWGQFFPALSEELQKFADFNQCPQLDDTVIEQQKRQKS